MTIKPLSASNGVVRDGSQKSDRVEAASVGGLYTPFPSSSLNLSAARMLRKSLKSRPVELRQTTETPFGRYPGLYGIGFS
jgi:hypothetical protein